MAEEQISGLGQVVTDIANMMGRKLDEHWSIQNQHSLQIDGLRRKFDEQEITLYEHGAILKKHGRDIREIKIQQNSMNKQMTNMNMKIDSIREEMNTKIDSIGTDVKQLIALVTQKATEE